MTISYDIDAIEKRVQMGRHSASRAAVWVAKADVLALIAAARERGVLKAKAERHDKEHRDDRYDPMG
jgi:hypothetical protein